MTWRRVALSPKPMTNLSYGPFISRAQAKKQGLKWYFNGNPCKRGHLSVRQTSNGCCQICTYTNASSKQYKKEWAAKNQDYMRKASRKSAAKKMREIYSDPILTSNYREEARLRAQTEHSKAMRKQWAEQNSEKIRGYTQAHNRKRSGNPELKIAHRLRERVRTALKHCQGIKTGRTESLVGCTWAKLRTHLEFQFTDGMTWEKMGLWHIDHIRPCASFDLTDPEQQKECFHFSNLQPLWAEDNLRKSDKWEPMAA